MKCGNHTRRAAFLLALVPFLALAGCVSDDAPTGPRSEAPTLPDTSEFSLDFGFFGGEQKSFETTQQHFLNAAIRVAVFQTVANFVLTPPIAAFAVALHTVPTRQPDGSYLWVYTHVYGTQESQIRLRGEPTDRGAAWQLRITALHLGIESELWFDGETSRWGDEGFWRFYDFGKPGDPMVARLEWENTPTSKSVSFTDLFTNVDDVLAYREEGDACSIDYHDASDASDWFIRWDRVAGAGSLQVPDYNGGDEACWDGDRNDTSCAPAF